ncbi:MAG: hypothetical protein HY870_03220 [Chloroflexi bacterium]|nr:hypothetical protein [Chloroflexota bacterium]
MKLRFALMTLLFALVLSACGAQGAPVPADPVEAVKVIADKQAEIKTQHLDVTLDLGLKLDGLSADDPSAQQAMVLFKNFKANLTLAGDVDTTKNDVALKGSADLGPLTAFLSQGADKVEFELVKVGDKMYVKGPDGEWNESDVTAGDTTKPDANPQISAKQLSDLLKKASKAEKLGDEAIDGVDSYHYKDTLDPLTLLTEAAKLAQASGASEEPIDQAQLDEAKKFLKDSVVIVEVWVGKQDLFIRQQKIVFQISVTEIPEQPGGKADVYLSLTTKTTKINEPVTITAPK